MNNSNCSKHTYLRWFLTNFYFLGVDPSKVGWYFDAFRLPTEDFKDGFASFSKLKIPIEELSSSGRKFTCRSEESGAILFATVTVRAEGEYFKSSELIL